MNTNTGLNSNAKTNTGPIGVRLLALAIAVVVLFAGYFLFVRPWFLQWGATQLEAARPLPGDGILSGSAIQETRAITIYANVEQVWPWLAQVGQDRGGFYSFDILENLVGCRMPTNDRLRPDRQTWAPGDKLWMYPPEQAGGAGFATLREIIPRRALAFGTHMVGTPAGAPEDGSWSFILEPMGSSATRLLIRGRGTASRPLLGLAFDRTIFEPLHFVMERRMMLGVKQLAEGTDRGRLQNHIHVAFFTLAFGLWIAAAAMVLRRRRWLQPLAGFVAAGAAFQILTFGQPPLIVGLDLLVAVCCILWWPIDPEPKVVHQYAITGRQAHA